MSYGDALYYIRAGDKVTCDRWNSKKVYVFKKTIDGVTLLLLHDENRNKTVVFTPSVENQLEDLWSVI